MPRLPLITPAGLACLTLAAGCGTAPPTRLARVPVEAPTPPPALAPGLPLGAEDPAARAAVGRTVAAVKALRGFTLDMPWMQKQGTKVARGRYTVAGKAPRTTRIEIVEGSNSGTRVLYTGGSSARVRAGGLLGAIAITLPITDDRLKSLRGYTIRETDLTGLMAQFGHPGHRARLVPGVAPRLQVEVAGGPLLAGCVRMVTEIDPTTALPLAIHEFDARECVFTMEMRNLRAAPDVSTDL